MFCSPLKELASTQCHWHISLWLTLLMQFDQLYIDNRERVIVAKFVLLQSYKNWFIIVHRLPITYLLGCQELLVAAWAEVLDVACQRISGNLQSNNRSSLMGSWLLEKGSDGSICDPKLWNLFRNYHVWLNGIHFSLPIQYSILTLGSNHIL